MRRDAITLRFIIALPMLQLFLFGYAINTDPKHLPAGLLSVEHSKYERTLAAALRNSGYYDISILSSEAEAERGLAQGKLLFVINIPPNFDRSVDRGETPSILVDADATDPVAIGNAAAALAALSTALDRDLPPVRQLPASAPPFQFVLHARYNPEQLTVLNIVPGLICVVLLISTLLVTALSITRERERGTMENLLAMPVRPIEVMLAKIVPYVFVDYIQVVLILTVSTLFFQLPVRGSVALLLVALGLFIASNLALGITFSTVAANQMQAIVCNVYFSAVNSAFGLHVPVQGHAGLGAMGWRNHPRDARDAGCARTSAQGKSPAGHPPGTLADRALRAGGHHDRGLVLPRDARLNARLHGWGDDLGAFHRNGRARPLHLLAVRHRAPFR